MDFHTHGYQDRHSSLLWLITQLYLFISRFVTTELLQWDHLAQWESDITSTSLARGIKLNVCNNSGVGKTGLRVDKSRIVPSRSMLTAFFPLDLRMSWWTFQRPPCGERTD